MEYDHILIRYGELGLKGKNINQFIKQLQQNIRFALKEFKHVKVTRSSGRLFIVLNGHETAPIIEKCKKIFGIYSMSLALKVENSEEAIKEGALQTLLKANHVKTFKVAVRRANKQFPIQSQQMNQLLGAYLLKNTSNYRVDVHHPDLEVRVEIREKATYIYSEVIEGAGGLPVGTGGKSLLLLSGGLDSPVAGYLLMKRGVELEMIHFHSPPFTSEQAKQKVLDLTEVLTSYGGKITVHLVPFTELQQKIFAELPDRYGMTVMRRIMLTIAHKLSEKRNILAIATGESLGQVASQTMASMNAINEVTNIPVLRPLVTFDKEEIIHIAKEIGTYDISIRPYEDCCTIFIPKSPVTNPKREKVKLLESKVDFSDQIEKSIAGIQIIEVDNVNKVEAMFEDLL